MAKVQQVNLRHCEAAAALVGDIEDSIYLLQEPYYIKYDPNRPGVRTPSCYHAKPGSRAGIYASALKSFKFVPMHEFTDDDISVGSIEGGILDNPVIIASIYLDYNYTTILPKMDELVQFCSSNNKRLICGIDCNAHSGLWGCRENNGRGDELEEYIFEKELYVHNTGYEPTWSRVMRDGTVQSSIIDITISMHMEDDIHYWRVSDEATFSDHRMLRFEVGQSRSSKITCRNFAKANWVKFGKYIDTNLNDCPSLTSETILEESISHLYDVIEGALDLACPKLKVKKKDTFVWWNHDCENAKRHCISLERKMRSLGATPDRMAEIKIAKRRLRYLIRKSKRESFRDLVRETESVSEMTRLNKILDKKESSALGFVRKADGTSTSSTQETLEVMMEENFPGCVHITDMDTRSNMEGDPRPVEPLEWIDNHRVREAFKMFKPHKAAGPDGLKPIVLQQLPEKAITFLTNAYTQCIQMGFTPVQWCHSKAIFLPKPGKKSYKEPRSHRPICLMPYLFKGLERLTVWHIEETALSINPLHDKQFAFRKNRSTENALSESINEVEKALYRKQKAIVIDLDIKGAFNEISTDAIINAMEKKNVDHSIVCWYGDYLKHRTCEAELGGSKVMAQITRGCPQGGVASPVVSWCFPYDPLLEAYDNSGVKPFGFADDTRLVITGCDMGTMMQTAQWAIRVAEKWAASVGVEFSPEKTSVMFFNRGLFRPVAETLKIYGRPIPWSD